MKEIKPGKDYIGVGGGVLIFNSNGEVLLMRRGPKSKNEIGYWQKPGGEVDYGEKALKCMTREVKEELDINVDIFGYLPHTDHIIKKDGQHWVAFNYIGKIKSGTPKIMEPEKCDKIEWFNVEKLPRKVSQTTIESIKNYKEKKYIKL